MQFQRSIEADGAARAGLSALVWADFNRSYRCPEPSPTRPVPARPEPLAALAGSSEPAKPPTTKGVHHA